MSTTDDTVHPGPGTHPVMVFAARLDTRLDDLASTSMLSMTPTEQRDGLVTLARAEAKLVALKLRLLADAETGGACTETGAATWVAVATRQTRRTARCDLKLALALQDHPVLADAMATGHVCAAQAKVITGALDALPPPTPTPTSPPERSPSTAGPEPRGLTGATGAGIRGA